jgi:hypothetical protein
MFKVTGFFGKRLGGGGPVPNPLWAYTVFQTSFTGADGGTIFTDETGRHNIVRLGTNAMTETDQFVSSPSSFLSNNNSGLRADDNQSDFSFGTGDFTIQLRARPVSLTGYLALIRANWTLLWQRGVNVRFQGTTVSDVLLTSSPGDAAVSVNTWDYWEVSRIGTTLSLYRNTNRIAQATSAFDFNTNSPLFIADNTGVWFPGYIDDVRVLKGVGLNSAATITVPDAPFPGEFL